MNQDATNQQIIMQFMYTQMLSQYQSLQNNLRQQNQQNLELYAQLQKLMQQKISLLSLEVPTQATLPQPNLIHEQSLESQNKISSSYSQNKSQRSRQHKIKKQNRVYHCTYPNCTRNYRSSVSMNLHIKLKHNGGTKRQREALAKLIIDAEQNGEPKPQMTLNLPPDFLEQYRKTYEYSKKYNM